MSRASFFSGAACLRCSFPSGAAYSATRPVIFAEAAFYTAILYDFLVLPGAVMILVSGPLLIRQLGLGYFDAPWLVGMWGLFPFEFIEGNTVTRVQFGRTLRLSRALPEDEPLTEDKHGRRADPDGPARSLPRYPAVLGHRLLRGGAACRLGCKWPERLASQSPPRWR